MNKEVKKETAQEVPVQEPLDVKRHRDYITDDEYEIITKDIFRILARENLDFSQSYKILDLCKKDLEKICFIII